jgi:hypothetical protein
MALGEICQREPLEWYMRVSTAAAAAAAISAQLTAVAAPREPKTANKLKRAYRACILGGRVGVLAPHPGPPEGEHRQVKEARGPRLHGDGGCAFAVVLEVWARGRVGVCLCNLRPDSLVIREGAVWPGTIPRPGLKLGGPEMWSDVNVKVNQWLWRPQEAIWR